MLKICDELTELSFWADGYSFFLWKNIVFGVMQIAYIGHRIQMLQLIMSWKTRCISLGVIHSNDIVGDNNIDLQDFHITTCVAYIINLHQK